MAPSETRAGPVGTMTVKKQIKKKKTKQKKNETERKRKVSSERHSLPPGTP